MTVARSLALYVLAAIAEIGGAYLVWQAIRGGRGWLVGLAGCAALGLYGVVAAAQPEDEFGRVFAAYGGIFIAGSIVWGAVFEGFRPDRYDIVGAAVCLVGMALIMFGPRSG
ncbi:YnfA family protein [soil metagenome]|jgi:small multidrug resistance family-3 protein